MEAKLRMLIFDYGAKSEWLGYYTGSGPKDDPLMKEAVLERDIVERKILEFLKSIEIKEKNVQKIRKDIQD